MTFVVVCVDIGIINLGFAVVKFTTTEDFSVIFADKFDISNFSCDRSVCTMSHDNIMADWMGHFMHEQKQYFDMADKVLVERQPPVGFRDAEQLLVHCFRDKAVLIHPRSFQAYFGVSGHEYDHRKIILVRKAKNVYHQCSSTIELLEKERAHDIADALLFAIYYVNTTDWKTKLLPHREKLVVENAEKFFQKFIYKRSEKL